MDNSNSIVDKYGGIAINKKTGKRLTVKELKELAKEFDKVRDKISVDEFMDKYLTAITYNEYKQREGKIDE